MPPHGIPRGGWHRQAIRLHPVSNAFGDEFDGQERHSARWPNAVPGVMLTYHGGWYRQAIRLHLVSGDPPDAKKPHIRLAGRIGWVAPTTAGGTVEVRGTGARGWHRKGGWHRQAIRLHLVSGDPPDPKKPHIRLVGRIGWVAPSRVGGTSRRSACT